jgi:hypothetical protein
MTMMKRRMTRRRTKRTSRCLKPHPLLRGVAEDPKAEPRLLKGFLVDAAEEHEVDPVSRALARLAMTRRMEMTRGAMLAKKKRNVQPSRSGPHGFKASALYSTILRLYLQGYPIRIPPPTIKVGAAEVVLEAEVDPARTARRLQGS